MCPSKLQDVRQSEFHPDPPPTQILGLGQVPPCSGLSFLICEMGTEAVQPTLRDSEGYMTSGLISKLSHLPPLPPSTSASSSSSLHALLLSPPPTLLPHHPRQRRPSAKNYGHDTPGPETSKMNTGSDA